MIIAANASWGIYNFRRNLITRLVKNGHFVCSVSARDRFSEKIESLGSSFEAIHLNRDSLNIISELRTLFGFLGCYMRVRPGVVLNFNPKTCIYSSLACRLLSIPYINNISGLGRVSLGEGALGKLILYLYKITQSKAELVFFQNPDDMETFIKYGLVRKDKAQLVKGSGVDLDRFSPRESVNDGDVKFLLVSRMIEGKGVFYFIEAAKNLLKKYKSARFYLLGPLEKVSSSGISRGIIEAWEHQKIVSYLGESDYVEEQIAKMDCIVLPSFYGEGVPKALLEAAAMAKPLITTNNVGCKETLEDGVTGFLCEPQNAQDLANQMEKVILMSHEDRLKMGHRGRQKIENEFDEELILDSYSAIIEP